MPKKKTLFIDYWPDINYHNACGAGLGSSLFKLAAIADAANAGYETHLLTSPIKKELLEDASGIDFIYAKKISKDLAGFHKVINLGIPDAELPEEVKVLENYCGFNTSHKAEYKSSPHTEFWRTFVSQCLNYSLTNKEVEVNICLESMDIIKAIKLMDRQYKWVAIPYQSISKLKDYPQWDDVIENLLRSDSKVRVILLGDKEQKTSFGDGVLNLMGKTDIQLLKAVISQVDLVAGVDGLATNIAMALKKRTLILFSMIAPENVVFDSSNKKIKSLVAGNCPYQFCYSELENYRDSECRYLHENPQCEVPKCLEFKKDDIVAEILSNLS